MRQAAVRGDFPAFKAGVLIGDMTEADAKQLMNEVRRGLGYEPVAGGYRRSTRRVKRMRARTAKTRKNDGVRIVDTHTKEYRIGPDGCQVRHAKVELSKCLKHK